MEPEPIRDPEVIKRFKITCELFELSWMIMRQNLRRRFPDESPEAIERRLKAWHQKRPYDGPEPPPTLAELFPGSAGVPPAQTWEGRPSP